VTVWAPPPQGDMRAMLVGMGKELDLEVDYVTVGKHSFD
jgi:hypothetical protein